MPVGRQIAKEDARLIRAKAPNGLVPPMDAKRPKQLDPATCVHSHAEYKRFAWRVALFGRARQHLSGDIEITGEAPVTLVVRSLRPDDVGALRVSCA